MLFRSLTNLLKSYGPRHEVRFVESSRKSKFSMGVKTKKCLDDVLKNETANNHIESLSTSFNNVLDSLKQNNGEKLKENLISYLDLFYKIDPKTKLNESLLGCITMSCPKIKA